LTALSAPDRPKLTIKCNAISRAIIEARERFLGIFAGRRWGKSWTLRDRSKVLTLGRPRSLYWYIAPQYSNVVDQFEETLADPQFEPFVLHTKLQPYPRIFMRNGSVLGYRTFEHPRRIRGKGLDWVDVDEIQDINSKQFWPVIRPLISDKRGQLAVAGQFRGRNWYHDEFYVKGQQYLEHPNDPAAPPLLNSKYNPALYKSWRLRSASGVAFTSPEGIQELAIAKAQMPKFQWEIEYECNPIGNEFAAFDPADIEKLFEAGIASAGPRPGFTYIAGIDLGRVKDHTAIVILEVQSGRVVHVEQMPLGMKHEVQAPKVAAIVNRYRALPIVDYTGGATGGHVPHDSYTKYYEKFLPNLKPFWWSKNKEDVCKHMLICVEQTTFKIDPQFEQLRREMLAYEVEAKRGYYDFHAADGEKDDTVAALAITLWARYKNWGPSTSGSPLSAVW
jgi:hypothetical protein